MNEELKKLYKRILDISYRRKLSHIGSCLTACGIINDIFKVKKPDEKFVLSCGHAFLGLAVVLEKYGGRNAEEIFDHHGVHPDRCEKCGIDCSSGSLGHGLGIAVGMALSDRTKKVWCLISDGECAEGSIWEALRIASENDLQNLKIHVNANSWGAYKAIDLQTLESRLVLFDIPIEFRRTTQDLFPLDERIPFLEGQRAHYKVMNEEEYKQALEILK